MPGFSSQRSYGRNRSGPQRRPFRRGQKSFARQRNSKHSFAKKLDISLFVRKASNERKGEEYIPQYTFDDFAIDEKLKAAIAQKGYVQPTAIQDKAIPLILEGKDIIGIAETGTGKTAAFLLPLIHKALGNRDERVLIVAPTRELALQISKELISFVAGMRIYSAVCIGGAGMRLQISQLRGNPQFVIGTPGRLKDLVEKKYLRLGAFENIVLDEADRMLDMGFINDITFLMKQLPEKRQTLLFSATIPAEIDRLIHTFLADPARISVKSQDTSALVEQDVIYTRGQEEKFEKLCDLLSKKEEFSKVLVFGRTKHGVRKLSDMLSKRGFRSEAIHGNKTQSERKRALEMFRSNRVQVLVATDVAARGLDIDHVTHVVNFDLPATYEDYIHRIGRTGRANQSGTALTFV